VRYVHQPRSDEAATVAVIRKYAHEQPMYGYRIIAVTLKHDGYRINRKRGYRIWRQEGLQLPRRKTGKRRYGDTADALRRAGAPNEVWTYDFLEGRTERGGKLRGAPGYLRSDNGPEFVAYALQEWLRDRRFNTLNITPGSPWENPFIERFNGAFRG